MTVSARLLILGSDCSLAAVAGEILGGKVMGICMVDALLEIGLLIKRVSISRTSLIDKGRECKRALITFGCGFFFVHRDSLNAAKSSRRSCTVEPGPSAY